MKSRSCFHLYWFLFSDYTNFASFLKVGIKVCNRGLNVLGAGDRSILTLRNAFDVEKSFLVTFEEHHVDGTRGQSLPGSLTDVALGLELTREVVDLSLVDDCALFARQRSHTFHVRVVYSIISTPLSSTAYKLHSFHYFVVRLTFGPGSIETTF